MSPAHGASPGTSSSRAPHHTTHNPTSTGTYEPSASPLHPTRPHAAAAPPPISVLLKPAPRHPARAPHPAALTRGELPSQPLCPVHQPLRQPRAGPVDAAAFRQPAADGAQAVAHASSQGIVLRRNGRGQGRLTRGRNGLGKACQCRCGCVALPGGARGLCVRGPGLVATVEPDPICTRHLVACGKAAHILCFAATRMNAVPCWILAATAVHSGCTLRLYTPAVDSSCKFRLQRMRCL